MIKKLLKQLPLFTCNRSLPLFAASLFIINSATATTWFVNDNSLTGDVFTTAIGNNANPGTAASPFASLQFAIDAAVAGDSIYVDAGTYTSANIDITKASLTLRGAKFGIAAGPDETPANRGTGESIIEAGIYYGPSLDNISVDGFTFNVGTNLWGITARGLNSTIINNIVIGTVTATVQQAGIATRANAPLRLHSYRIENNNVRGFRYGFYMDGNLESPSEINYNYATGCFTAGFVFTASNGHHIKANVSETNGQGMLITEGSNLVEANTVTGNAVSGIRLAGSLQTSNNTIINNFITNNSIGINLTDDNAASVNNQAHYNSITGNVVNIANTHSASFDATCNWFGSAIAPLIAAQITGGVTFNPFLTDGIDTDPVDGFQPVTACIVVPVVLTTFTATVKNYDVLLNWQTASEVNSSHFSIERSADYQSFLKIGQVQARGFSDVKVNYNFTDNKPVNFDKPTYYRLAMTDLDGTKKYSKIISVTLKTNGSFVKEVYPNPVETGKVLHTSFIAGSPEKITISFVNATGQVLRNYHFQALKGANIFDIVVPGSAATSINFLLIRSSAELKKVPVYIY